MNASDAGAKRSVYQFWNAASCGEELYLSSDSSNGGEVECYKSQAEQRYKLEPYIRGFAQFESCRALQVLEIGVGLGADHAEFARCGALLSGVDLTERAIEHTRRRLDALGLSSNLAVGDAERLGFDSGRFDIVYSWGVLHHSPDTPAAIHEVWRILKPQGIARIMIYHKFSLVGFMLWLRYAFMRFRPFVTLDEIYARYLESPGTKAYTCAQARRLFSDFREVSISTVLTHGDLLSSGAGQRHRGFLLTVMRVLWPRWIIKLIFSRCGLFMLIEARK